MSDNVIRLPEPVLLRWAPLAKEMAEGLVIGGCSEPEIQYVVSQAKSIFLSHPHSISAEATDTKALIAEINRQVQAIGNALLLEIVKRDLELYRLRGETPNLNGGHHDR